MPKLTNTSRATRIFNAKGPGGAIRPVTIAPGGSATADFVETRGLTGAIARGDVTTDKTAPKPTKPKAD